MGSILFMFFPSFSFVLFTWLIYDIFTLKLTHNLFSGAWCETFGTITGPILKKWLKTWHHNFSQSCLYIFVGCETHKTFNGASVLAQCLEDLCNAAMTMLHTALMTWLFMTCLKYFQLFAIWGYRSNSCASRRPDALLDAFLLILLYWSSGSAQWVYRHVCP